MPSTSGLSSREKRTAKRVAKDIIGSPAPVWSEVGEDEKNEMFQHLVKRLRDTKNSGIAKAIEEDEGLGWVILQEKCKSMRAEEKKQANKTRFDGDEAGNEAGNEAGTPEGP